ncbi:MAG: sigma-54 dependent transcriptional regulator [Myxococcota bacterium]|nr:sigma-54 dependent transcriptional regulator [Myxococcota bacterium]
MSGRRRRPERSPRIFHGMVSGDPRMFALFQKIQKAANSDATVLVRGESGTGKELVAHAIHAESPRQAKAFRGVNCATFTPELLASELFGHTKGAFTGAVRDKAGLLVQADGGTLFLDEVAEMPVDLQARLLRVLQLQRFTPVGGTSPVEVDVRFISATNAPLRRMVAKGRFREDLMYRLRVVVLYLPRLAEREGDLELLTWHFIDQFSQRSERRIHAIDERAWQAMMAYPWPGNIRELRNNLESAFVLGEGPVLHLDELAPEVQGLGAVPGDDHWSSASQPVPLAPIAPEPINLEQLERERILEAWHTHRGRRSKMAEALGMSRSTLYRKMKKLGLDP